MRIETKEPVDGEIRSAWFTLPTDEEEVSEILGIDAYEETYRILETEAPFAEDYEEISILDTQGFPCSVSEYSSIEELNSLYNAIQELPDYLVDALDELIDEFGSIEGVCENQDRVIYHSECADMADVARYYVLELGILGEIPPFFTEFINYEDYGATLLSSGTYIETSHGMYEITY